MLETPTPRPSLISPSTARARYDRAMCSPHSKSARFWCALSARLMRAGNQCVGDYRTVLLDRSRDCAMRALRSMRAEYVSVEVVS